jgi:predicted RNase H-like nuclease (RuvC/YqgF family)
MLKKIRSLFYKIPKKAEPLLKEDVETIVEPPPEPPDVIEVPWQIVARVKNTEDAITKLHEDLKDFFYKNKMTEKRIFDLIAKLEDSSEEEEEKIKKSYHISDNTQYVLELPEATGRSGFLKKKKQNK